MARATAGRGMAAATEFVAPVVIDDKGHEITRTLRVTDKLYDLMDFYYTMAPAVPRGKGVFLYQGKRIVGERTPASYEMKSGDKIEFFAEMKQSIFINLTVQDGGGRRVTRTMRRTEELRVLMDFYRAMVTPPASSTTSCVVVEGVFTFQGTLVEGERTPEYYRMEDGAQIDFPLPKVSKPSAAFVTLSVADIDGRKVTRTMRKTDKLKDLMDFYYDSLPIVPTQGGKFALDGETVHGWETPEQLGMEDGYALDFCFPENCFICNGDLSRLDLLFKRR